MSFKESFQEGFQEGYNKIKEKVPPSLGAFFGFYLISPIIFFMTTVLCGWADYWRDMGDIIFPPISPGVWFIMWLLSPFAIMFCLMYCFIAIMMLTIDIINYVFYYIF